MKNCTLIGYLGAVVFLVGILTTAISKEMHPKLPNDQTKIQSTDTKEQQPPQPPIVVNVIPPQRTHAEIEQEAKDRKEKADSDRKLIAFNGQLANYTLGVFIATSLLFIANISLGIFAYRSIVLTEKTLVLTQRPKLRVRNVSITQAFAIGTPPSFREDQTIKGEFTVANIGGADATITKSHCLAFPTDRGLPMNRPCESMDPNNPVPKVTLQPGETTKAHYTADQVLGVKAVHISKFTNNYRLYVMGWVEYIDALNIKRCTTFCREWRRPEPPGDPRFFPVKDEPDYEQED